MMPHAPAGSGPARRKITLVHASRYDPGGIAAAVEAWLGSGVRVTTRPEGEDLHVLIEADPGALEDLAASVVTFYLCWRKTRRGVAQRAAADLPAAPAPPSRRAQGDLGQVDPAAFSFVPGPRRG